MRDLYVSALGFFIAELGLFVLLWQDSTLLTVIASFGHLVIAVLAALWFGQHWSNPAVSRQQVWWLVGVTVALLPLIGCLLLAIIENKDLLREQGLKAGLGTEQVKKHTPKDLLHYFSAPDFNPQENVRKTRDLLSSLDDEAYLGLLIASRHLPDKEAYALLSEALLSPFESARLMAYSLKGKLEEQMQSDLQNKLDALKTASPRRRADLHLAVAHDYLHLLDVGVESSSKAELLKHASDHSVAALREDRGSGSAYSTLSKVLEYQGNTEAAMKARNQAMRLGVSEKETTLNKPLTA